MDSIKYMKRFPLILILIILVCIFFRTYQLVERFEFAHDGDLYSWIVKDIVVNRHSRLIGQLTSAPGIFIGSFFYYLLVPFFLLTNMDPIGVTILGVIVGVLTIISYYFVLGKLFNRTTGIIASFLHAVLIPAIGFDRWIVPTIPTKLWAIWYLYTLIMMIRGNFSVLPVLGILIGLIWQVHIALFPTLLAVPIALSLSRKLPNPKQILLFLSGLVITSTPFILFEVRHNFLQTMNLITNFTSPHSGEIGLPKLIAILKMIAKNTNSLFFSPQSLPKNLILPFLLTIFAVALLPIKYKLLKFKESLVLFTWVLGVILSFSFSRTPISEYYFANLEVIFLTIVSLVLTLYIKSFKPGLYFVIFILGIILFKNATFLIQSTPYLVGYIDRKAAVNYITQDAKSKNYPCIGITYITRIGENVGFRYFFYLNKMHLVHPSLRVPVYNIVIPDELSKNEVKEKFGHIGLIPPNHLSSKEIIDKECQTPDTNLTDSLFGYVE